MSRIRGAAGQAGRRGLLAGFAALVAGALAKVRPAEAADGDAMILGQINAASSETTLNRSNLSSQAALLVTNTNGQGILANSGNGVGVWGVSGNGSGIFGGSNSFPAVWGSSGNSVGVYGNSAGTYGVYGRGPTGVVGLSPVGGYGVLGLVTRDSSGGAGVYGNAPRGLGVWGLSGTDVGVFGESTDSGGVMGRSVKKEGVFGFSVNGNAIRGWAPTFAGVVGATSNPSSTGVAGFASNSGGHAGVFWGAVTVVGTFTATGGSKSSAVPHPDGTLRRLHCLESPESWFEDVRRATLANGVAQVRLDPDFAAIVRTDDYHVFITPEGDSKGLYVADRGAGGFTVREQQGGTSSIPFSYRVVARRADVKAARLEKVPALKAADLVEGQPHALIGPGDERPPTPEPPEFKDPTPPFEPGGPAGPGREGLGPPGSAPPPRPPR